MGTTKPDHLVPEWTDEVQEEFCRLYDLLGNTGSRDDIMCYLIVENKRLQRERDELKAAQRHFQKQLETGEWDAFGAPGMMGG